MTWTTLPRSEIDGTTQGYRCGVEGAPQLILLHGVGLALDAWSPQIEALSQRYRLVLLDLPGHGGSAALGEGAGLPDYVAWLAAVIARLGSAPVSLAGHSMGALIALGMAVEHGELLSRVALLNGVLQRDAKASAAVIARADQITAGDMDPLAPLSRWFNEDQRAGDAYQLTAELLAQSDPAGYAQAYRAFAEGDRHYAARLGEVCCPLLSLTGAGDANSTAAMAERMAALAADGEAVVITDHRHMVNLTAPEAVNEALLRWMERENGRD